MPKPTKYRGGIIRQNTRGTWDAEYNLHRDRPRKTHKTLQLAKDWLDSLIQEVDTTSHIATPEELQDAQTARQILGGKASLATAAQFWLEASGAALTSITVAHAVDKYIEVKEEDNLRPRAIETTRHKTHKLSSAYPDLLLEALTPEHLRKTLTGSPQTRNSTRRYYNTFFRWAIQNGYLRSNPVDGVTKAQTEEGEPNRLTLSQVHTLLHTATENDPELVPRIATALFTGIRSAELERMGRKHFKDGKIHLGAEVTKRRNRRILEIFPNLPEWLTEFPPSESLKVTNHRKREDRIRQLAGIVPWPHNALRDSFATYHLALHQDAGKTTYYTRHANQQTLYSHYIDMATQEDGAAYFGIIPSTTAFSTRI